MRADDGNRTRMTSLEGPVHLSRSVLATPCRAKDSALLGRSGAVPAVGKLVENPDGVRTVVSGGGECWIAQ
jgi:hypothetical protein